MTAVTAVRLTISVSGHPVLNLAVFDLDRSMSVSLWSIGNEGAGWTTVRIRFPWKEAGTRRCLRCRRHLRNSLTFTYFLRTTSVAFQSCHIRFYACVPGSHQHAGVERLPRQHVSRLEEPRVQRLLAHDHLFEGRRVDHAVLHPDKDSALSRNNAIGRLGS